MVVVTEPRDLFTLAPDRPRLDDVVLLVALDGFVDAGGAARLTRDHLLGALDGQVVATFDVDLLHDYRARRPIMLFAGDHWESCEAPSLRLHLLHDLAGRPFLLLAGPEPDVLWERFVAAVRLLVEEFGIRLVIGLDAIPMAVPHTRPVGVIAHASRKELVVGYQPWVDQVQVPGSAGHLIEFRLGQDGRDVMGFAAHVPHYLVQTAYPAAAVALIEAVSRASGLTLPTDALEVAATTTRKEIDAQVAESAEVTEVVRALQTQYDAFVAGAGRDLLAGGQPLPTADELGAELERFLAERQRRKNDES